VPSQALGLNQQAKYMEDMQKAQQQAAEFYASQPQTQAFPGDNFPAAQPYGFPGDNYRVQMDAERDARIKEMDAERDVRMKEMEARMEEFKKASEARRKARDEAYKTRQQERVVEVKADKGA